MTDNLLAGAPARLSASELDRIEASLSRRVSADPEGVEKGLARLVLTIVELLRQLMSAHNTGALLRTARGARQQRPLSKPPAAGRVEASFWTGEQLHAYLEMLLDKVDQDWYPSHELPARIQRLLAYAALVS